MPLRSFTPTSSNNNMSHRLPLCPSAASIVLLHAFLLTLLLGAAVSAASSVPWMDHGDVNTTAFANGSATTPDAGNHEMYYCFLCTGRNPLLIHRCPIYWDECHMLCWDDTSSTAANPAAPAPPAPVPPPSLGSAHPMAQGEDCYVMKLYMSGRYVIVEHRNCDYIGSCFLTCGGGELADRKAAMGTTTAVSATTAAIQGRFQSSELCGTQVNAPPAPPSVDVVPVDGARRRR